MPNTFLKVLALLFRIRAMLRHLVYQYRGTVLRILCRHLVCLGRRGIDRSEWVSSLGLKARESLQIPTR
jgi:hypothetical protein